MLVREIEMNPAFDKRHEDPTTSYGIHCVALPFILKDDTGKGAVQFMLFTGWYLPHVEKEFTNHPHRDTFFKPMPADKGFHSPHRIYKRQKSMTKKCPYLNGKPCYYDGSGLNAEPLYQILLKEGSEGVWKALEKYWNIMFGDNEEGNS